MNIIIKEVFLKITFDNFCDNYTFHPLSSDLSPGQKTEALLGTLALGILTLGIWHLACYIKKSRKVIVLSNNDQGMGPLAQKIIDKKSSNNQTITPPPLGPEYPSPKIAEEEKLPQPKSPSNIKKNSEKADKKLNLPNKNILPEPMSRVFTDEMLRLKPLIDSLTDVPLIKETPKNIKDKPGLHKIDTLVLTDSIIKNIYQGLPITNWDIDQFDYRAIFNEIDERQELSQEDRSYLKGLMIGEIMLDLGQEFGIELELKIEDHQFRTVGTYSSLMHAKLAVSISKFFKEFPDSLPSSEIAAMEQTLKNSVSYSEKIHIPNSEQSAYNDFKSGKPITIGSGWVSHATEITLQMDEKGNAFLVYTNRSEPSKRDPNLSTMKVYQIGDVEKVDESFFATIIRSNQELEKDEKIKYLEDPGSGMHKLLNLKLIGEIEKSIQKVGNCSWTSAKSGFHALLLFPGLIENIREGMDPGKALIEANEGVKELYKKWQQHNKIEDLTLTLPVLTNQARDPNSKLNFSTYKIFLEYLLKKLENKFPLSSTDQKMIDEVKEHLALISTGNNIFSPIDKFVVTTLDPRKEPFISKTNIISYLQLTSIPSGTIFLSKEPDNSLMLYYKSGDSILSYALTPEQNGAYTLRFPLPDGIYTEYSITNFDSLKEQFPEKITGVALG